MTPKISAVHNLSEILVPYLNEHLEHKKNRLFQDGFVSFPLILSENIGLYCHEKKWQSLDDTFLKETKKGKPLFELLNFFHPIDSIEFIISLRESKNEWEEDGIWHDDGSRQIAFTLSLTHSEEIQEGGILEIKRKEDSLSHSIPTPPFGHIIIFLTGIHGYEHKINKVEKGSRLIIAGWGS